VPYYANNNHWFNVVQVDSSVYGKDRESLMELLEKNEIQTRPVWALNHLQKPFRGSQTYAIDNANKQLDYSLCFPSSTNLTKDEIDIILALLNG